MTRHIYERNEQRNFKRNTTCESRCLNYVNSHPGCLASDIPSAYRRFLRILESRNAVVCVVKNNEFTWQVAE
jgi:hypothetical protein